MLALFYGSTGVRGIVGQKPAMLAACAEWGLSVLGGIFFISSIFDPSIPFLFFSLFSFFLFLGDGLILDGNSPGEQQTYQPFRGINSKRILEYYLTFTLFCRET